MIPFDYKMPKLSIVDFPEIPDLALVHWMHVAVGTLMYIRSCGEPVFFSTTRCFYIIENTGLPYYSITLKAEAPQPCGGATVFYNKYRLNLKIRGVSESKQLQLGTEWADNGV